MAEAPPPTRWAAAGPARGGYAENFARLVASGADVDGEARLADALLPRGARVLDVGSGMGRVAAALAARGHDVVAVEPDPDLVAQSRRTYPDLEVLEADVLAVSADDVGTFDLVVCVGNVLVFLAEGTERPVLERLRSLLRPGGRVLAGFHLRGAPPAARRYSPEAFIVDAEAAGLRVDLRAGSYELHPPTDAYAVWLLSAAG
ncbi:class I SAM-dependent methyltransferase [Nocardioides sp. SOB77]|uniref:Class I SAM-dependent methyltransferase n=1 Tax=Nocardioides oceani TaxID=3058369 RepID=A0ABT8FGM8_9ACTN|nr:class I SAM-dependent methyltransferase [Nocardioides oceani]MDN4173839.1 class I SAM-dependent methyltransferase [Nocardioides oceani]